MTILTGIGWRYWGVHTATGKLYSADDATRAVWGDNATATAVCTIDPYHRPPEPGCICGLHLWTSAAWCIAGAETEGAQALGMVRYDPAEAIRDNASQHPNAPARRVAHLTIVRLWYRADQIPADFRLRPPAGVPAGIYTPEALFVDPGQVEKLKTIAFTGYHGRPYSGFRILGATSDPALVRTLQIQRSIA